MTKTKVLIVGAAAFAALASTAVPAATAAGSNPWTKIGTVHDNFNQPGVAVGSDGGLHVVWGRNPTNSTQDVVHTPVSLTGNVGTSAAVQTGWGAVWPVPDLISTSSGLQAFWDGSSPDQTQGMFMASSSTGSTWTLQQGLVAQSGIASSVGADTGSGGIPLVSWDQGVAGVFVHAGTDPSTPNYNVQTQLGGCCGYTPDIAMDASSGAAWVVWASNATNHVGVYAQQINATSGEPIGAAARLPQSATTYAGTVNFDQQIIRTPVAANPHAAYVAYPAGYPSPNRILLWKLSSAGISSPMVVATGSGFRVPGIAADAKGRIWVTWAKEGSATVYARRSNPSVSRFGATVKVGRSPGSSCDLFEVTPAAATSRLHVVGTFTCGSTSDLYYTRLFPGLSVSASPAHFSGKSKVVFTVTDAGVPVKGATVTVGGKTDTTDSSGHAAVTLGPVTKKTSFTATATAHNYVRGRTTVVVKPK